MKMEFDPNRAFEKHECPAWTRSAHAVDYLEGVAMQQKQRLLREA